MNSIEILIEQALNQVVTLTQCKLCDVKLSTAAVKTSHFSCKRHKANVNLFREEVRQNVSHNLENTNKKPPVNFNNNPNNIAAVTEAKPFHCKACSRKFAAKQDLDNHNITESHLRIVECYCFTCSLLTVSKEHLWDHFKSEKHQKQVKTAGLPPMDGKYSPFSQKLPIDLVDQMSADYCFICKIKFTSIQLCIEHYTGSSHETAAELWLKSKQNEVKQLELKQSRLPPRFLKQKIQKLENQQREAEKNQNLMEPDLNSQISKSLAESEPKNLNNNNNICDNAINKTEIAEASIAMNATKQANSDNNYSENLKNKVLDELQKLVQKLYYSKEVPYNVGLDYLKKINKEVDEIIIRKKEEEEKRAFSIELNEAACSINQFIENGFNFKGFTEDEIAKYPVNFEKPIINETNNVLENNATPSSNNQINPEIKASKKKKKSKKPTNNKNISDLLKDIISKKQNCKENLDELELLSEIEVLLKQLENIEEAPLLENILKCLQDFNQELLDEIVFKKLKDDQQEMETKIIEQKVEADEEVEIEKININVEENVADNNIIVNKAVEPKSKQNDQQNMEIKIEEKFEAKEEIEKKRGQY